MENACSTYVKHYAGPTMYFLSIPTEKRSMSNTMSFLNLNFCIKLFILAFLSIPVEVQAQNNRIDSLKNELTLHKEKDTIRYTYRNSRFYTEAAVVYLFTRRVHFEINI